MIVTNTTNGPKTVGNVTIPPKQSRNVANWDEVKNDGPVVRKLEAGDIFIEGDGPDLREPALAEPEELGEEDESGTGWFSR
ncbi:MAG: hypothetical protein GVY36_18840 [Verrucomicrobia bacterium]|jgi:hypothetical protein|nr:hypothetical protein [Verrucomicrobiota bacterium]